MIVGGINMSNRISERIAALRLALIEGSRASDNDRASDTFDGAGVVYIDLSHARFEGCVVNLSAHPNPDERAQAGNFSGGMT